MRIGSPRFRAAHGNTFIVERLSKCGSTVYEFCWNTSKTPNDNPQLIASAWSLDISVSDIPDALYYADDETEAAIEAIEEAEAE